MKLLELYPSGLARQDLDLDAQSLATSCTQLYILLESYFCNRQCICEIMLCLVIELFVHDSFYDVSCELF